MIITFIGHSHLTDSVNLKVKIKRAICENAKGAEKIFYYCGGYGAFDSLCASACNELKSVFQNSEIILITPYINSISHTDDIYDSIIYPPLESVPLRLAILRRNEWMINESDLIIAYVENTFGGAYKSLCYAKRKRRKIINLAEL